MTQAIRAWEYVFGGLLFFMVGLATVLVPLLSGSAWTTTGGLPLGYLSVPVGLAFITAACHWLWTAARIERAAAAPPPVPVHVQ